MEKNEETLSRPLLGSRIWRKIRPLNVPNELPKPRQKFSLSVYDDSLFIYGGIDSNNNVLDDFYQFDRGALRWKKLRSAKGPGPLHSHSTVVFRSKLILMGGKDADGELNNEEWQYEFETETWNYIRESNLPRFGFSLQVVDGHLIRIYGGSTNEQHGVVYEKDTDRQGNQQFELAFGNFGLNQRTYFAAANNARHFYVYGNSEDLLVFSHVEKFMAPVKVPVTRVNGPACALVDDSLLMIGGVTVDNLPGPNQCYCQGKIKELNPTQIGELPHLSYHQAVTSLGSVFVFGGVKSDGQLSNDLYQFADENSYVCEAKNQILPELPDDIYRVIHSFLPLQDLLKFARLSKSCHLLIKERFTPMIDEQQLKKFGGKWLKRYRSIYFSLVIPAIGPAGSGKTQISATFGAVNLGEEFDPTVPFGRVLPTPVGDISVNVNELPEGDFGAMEFAPIAGVIALCDLTDKESLTKLAPLVNRQQFQSCPLLIVGNKADKKEFRVISADQLEQFAAAHRNALVAETNALDAESVCAAVALLVLKIVREKAAQEMNKFYSQQGRPVKNTNNKKKDRCNLM